ncbi:hypothetical protein RRG08_016636 [Elysia crispata]|uniref:Uncharacterized protein n=1 Tax=Elysia crispata TaxID=231223 RepID=A0AAE0YYP4_9GAST|nr:hypothetical protein RRG08_016636 [Elysia crispata]
MIVTAVGPQFPMTAHAATNLSLASIQHCKAKLLACPGLRKTFMISFIMDHSRFSLISALLFGASFSVMTTDAASLCQQNIANCTAEFSSRGGDCPSVKMLKDCVLKSFPTCSSTSFDQDIYYGTLGPTEYQVCYECQPPEQMASAYSRGEQGVKVSYLTGAIIGLISASLILSRT